MKKVREEKVIVRLGLALVLLLLCLATAYADPPGTERVSVDTAGGDPDGVSWYSSISADGRYVAFDSDATDLVAGDGNGWGDVFVRDRQANTTTRVSVDTTGGDPDNRSLRPSISAEGRYVAFVSDASDLVAGDGNGWEDVFVRDRQTNTTTRVSVDTTGGDPDGPSWSPSISADGRYVAFESNATDLVVGDGNGVTDVFVRDRQTNTTTRVSVDTLGGDPDGWSQNPSISADGRYVAFHSDASDLVLGDGNGTWDVFVRDLQTNTTTRVSVDTAGGDPDNWSLRPSISAEGRYVAFMSNATDLVVGDGNGVTDVFVRDRQTNTTTRVSVDTLGGDPDGWSQNPSISADGRYVAFISNATDLVLGDGNGMDDVFVRDRQTNTTTRVSVDTAGGDPDSFSWYPSISADGRYVVFRSNASDLVVGDGNGWPDVFVRSRGDPALTIAKQDNPDPAWAGEPLTYTLTVAETGGQFYATGMVVSDTVPVSTTFAWADNGGTLVGNDVLWTGLTVSDSQSISVTFVVTVNQVPSGTVITNDYYQAVISTTRGVTGATGSAVSTTVFAVPQLSIGKSAPSQVFPSELLTYTIVVSETGMADATGVLVTDTVPANTTFASAGQGGTLVGSDVVWSGQTVTKGSSFTLTFAVMVGRVPSGTVVTNDAYRVVSSDQGVSTGLGQAVNTLVGLGPVYLPTIQKSYVITP